MLSRLNPVLFLCLLMMAGALAALPSTSFASEASYEKTFSDKNASGASLAAAWLELLTTAGRESNSNTFVRPYLDPAFVLQRASGKRYTADNYVPPLIQSYEVGDVRETRPSPNVMVLRYSVRAAETAPDTALIMGKDKAPRLTVLLWNDEASRWRVVSHANFNVPVAAVCDRTPMTQMPLISPTSPEDYKLGIDTVDEFITLLEGGDAASILHPLYQVQTASGAGITTLAERKKPSTVDDMSYKDPIVTRNGPLLVFSAYFLTKQHTFMTVNQLRIGMVPHLLTFIEGDDGKWKMIANALFSPPAEVPEGTSCVVEDDLQEAL